MNAELLRTVALGCMRLSTAPDRDETAAVAALHAGLDAGVTLLDTADAYALDDTETGHNERLIARALASWNGDRSRVTIATKGGMIRPGGQWQPDGRGRHLRTACEASCRALGVDQIALYQLHAPDTRVPLATSVRALAGLKRGGLVASIGLCNVTVGQIEEARRIVEIDAVQVELSVWHDEHFLSGVVAYCLSHGLRVLAYRPLGGRKAHARTAADPVLGAVAARLDVTPFEVALAWLAGFSPAVVPLPGITRAETARSAVRAVTLALSDEDTLAIDALCPAARALRPGAHRVSVATRADADVVLIMGLPGAGKSTLARSYADRGYQRLNRDETGGTLAQLARALDRALATGHPRLVLDNTYVSRKARGQVLHVAAGHGVPVRCVWLDTPIEEAQVNAVSRLVARYGHLPNEEALAGHRKQDPGAFGPMVQFRYQRELEPPHIAEGFSAVDVVPFERSADASRVNRAVIIWVDGVLLRSRSGHRTPLDPDDVAVDETRGAALRAYERQGYRLLGLSWQPEIAEGRRTDADAQALFARLNDLLGPTIDVAYCPHAAGPPRCWCRKPLPGLGVLLTTRHGLDPGACIYVGDSAQDPGFARRLGFQFRHASDFFS